MLRLMQAAHPHALDCEVIFTGAENAEMTSALQALPITIRRVGSVSVLALKRALQAFRPDVAYLFGQLRTLPWTLAARLAGVPVVVGAERSTISRPVDVIGRQLDRFVIDSYVCNSRRAACDLVERVGVPEDRVRVVYNGLPFPGALLAPIEDVQRLGTPSIVSVANLQPQKGHRHLLQAVRLLRGEFPRIRAVLVGKDLSSGAVLSGCDAEGLGDCYTWVGFVPEVRGYLGRADAFVLPSLHFEGVPTAIMEAMAEGVPVIASNVGGVSELVVDGETGVLVPPGDAAALAKQLRRLLVSADLRDRLTSSARFMIERQHSMQAMIAGHVAVFQKALNAKRSPRAGKIRRARGA